MQTPVHPHAKLVLSPLRDIQPVELVMYTVYCLQSTVIFIILLFRPPSLGGGSGYHIIYLTAQQNF